MDSYAYRTLEEVYPPLQDGPVPLACSTSSSDCKTSQSHIHDSLRTASDPISPLDPTEVREALSLLSQWLQQGNTPVSPLQNHGGSPWNPMPQPVVRKQSRAGSLKRSSKIKTWLRSNKQGLGVRLRRGFADDNDMNVPSERSTKTENMHAPQAVLDNSSSLLYELDASQQHILELPTKQAVTELPSESFDPPSYGALEMERVDRRPSPLAETPDEGVYTELDSITRESPMRAAISGTRSPQSNAQQVKGITRLNSTTRLLCKLREERQKLHRPPPGASQAETDAKSALESLVAYLDRQNRSKVSRRDEFWEGFWEALQEDDDLGVDQNMSAPVDETLDHVSTVFIPDQLDLGTVGACDPPFQHEGRCVEPDPLRQEFHQHTGSYNANTKRARSRWNVKHSKDVQSPIPSPSCHGAALLGVSEETVSAPVTPTGSNRNIWRPTDSDVTIPVVEVLDTKELTYDTLSTLPESTIRTSHSLPDLRSRQTGQSIYSPQRNSDNYVRERSQVSKASATVKERVMATSEIVLDPLNHTPLADNHKADSEALLDSKKAKQPAVQYENEHEHSSLRARFETQLTFGAIVLSSLFESTLQGVSLLRKLVGHTPIPDGHVRITWQCSCGEGLYDDFVEKRAGAAHELQSYLRGVRTHTNSNNSSPVSTRPSNSAFSTPGNLSPSSTHTWTPNTSASNSPSGPKPVQSFPTPVSTFSIAVPERSPPYLLTCADEGRFTPKLTHLDMGTDRISNDKDLALALRSHYSGINNKWYHYFRLRGLTMIDFVRFEAHKNRFADIRKRPDMPDADNRDYSFTPDLIPPVGSHYLIHLLNHPRDYEDESVAYDRMPKRMSKLGPGECGWGVELVEAFLPDRVWGLVFGVFGLGSVVFGVVWAVREHDVQGAFGVAAWVCGFAMLLIGWLQACFG